ncbi:MAG TPA: winged helix-turn-helix domain-containing protein [Candidatus Spyradenecus faecavium]|uniref:Winged helix-turn-helix domain-containing protein n=1 Tax=Candidatus Spyradenecus faecavium TaxID=2840947 RepID=A0A9D1NMD0_9BACT|nr:winged helix-turn-helix domain-containing protein [Candidatus Spyradenecus faecavium]
MDNQTINNGERVTVRVGRNILVAEVVEALNETTLKVRNPASGKEFLTSRARLVPSEPTAPTEPSEQLEPRGPTAVALPKMSLATIAYTVLEAEQRALSVTEILALAERHGLFEPSDWGKTPGQTLYSLFVREVKTKTAPRIRKEAQRGKWALA